MGPASTSYPASRALSTAGTVALVVAIFLAVLVGAWWLLSSPDRASASGVDEVPGAVLAVEDEADEPDGAAADDPDGAEELTEAVERALPEISYELVLTRDPFESVRPAAPEPVVTPPVVPVPDPPGNGTSPGPGPGPGIEPDPPRPGDPCQVGTESTVCEGTTVKVLAASASGARVQVGDVVHQPSIGDTFAQRYRLLDVQGGCALIRYDDRQTFRQCPVDSTFK